MSTKYPLVSVIIPSHNRKQKLIRLIKSIMDSDYPKDRLEIVVVDDASTDRTYEKIAELFPKIRIIRNERKRLVAASRNIGFRNSNGDFIFFIDDDNIVDKHCISEIIQVMLMSKDVGIAAPIMYYLKDPKMIWCAGVKRSMITSKTTYIGNGQVDRGQINKLFESDDFPNAFMVRREIMENEGVLFDEVIFPLMYEESDFCYRIRRKGWKVVLVPYARVYHDIPFGEIVTHYTKLKAYYVARNRILFHRKYSKKYEFILFILFFHPFINLFYAISFLQRRMFEEFRYYLRGIYDGIKMIYLGKFYDIFNNSYREL